MSNVVQEKFNPGSIVSARGREWVVLPHSEADVLYLRPLGGGEEAPTVIAPQLEREPVKVATFPYPDPSASGTQSAGLLLRDSLMLKLRAGAGPFRSFGNIAIEPRAYQLVPLMMALKHQTIRLLIGDDVGIGKTIEAGLIARELIDRGEINRLSVLCPPHLCEQWQQELSQRFHIQAEVVRSSTAARLERGLPAGSSIFTEYPFTVVSLDYIKSKNRRDAFAEQCPGFVIVDEAHTCSRTGQGRQQRYELLRDLASDENRHMVMLTATPHSGDEEAFYNLLALLDTGFAELKNHSSAEHPLRKKLAEHFIQRRRKDIKEWKEGELFPERYSAEVTYKLTGEWNSIFQDVLNYSRELVEREQEGTLKARMNWWAALALLRCISSSPQAAIRALNTRLDNVLGINDDGQQQSEEELRESLEMQGAVSVLDGGDDNLSFDDVEPGVAQAEDVERLKVMIDRARALKSSGDPKLKALIANLKPMLDEGFNPVVFCRYIATAEYLAEELKAKFGNREVIHVTGNLSPSERQAAIDALKDADKPPLLVATDCLSEGINLQEQFTAVIHYDLSWNPTRHEQREGRVDRFGQQSPQVKMLMLYGEDNPIDGAVLQVILRKAKAISDALGVSVPAPDEAEARYMQAIVNTVLLRRDGVGSYTYDMFADDANVKALDAQWESAREKAKRNRTIFAQNRLKPEEVMPEWEKAFAVLGTNEDVERFVKNACQSLQAALAEQKSGAYHLPLNHLPLALKERLVASGLAHIQAIDFHYPTRGRSEFIHRTHPLVSHIADYLTEMALAGADTSTVARAGAIYTQDVSQKTIVYLLRLRTRLSIKRTRSDLTPASELLAEEALALAIDSSGQQTLLEKADVVKLMQAKPTKNFTPEARLRELTTAIDKLPALAEQFQQLAHNRAEAVLNDHRRIREASEARGTYSVQPQLPVDVMGVYVLVPDASGLL